MLINKKISISVILILLFLAILACASRNQVESQISTDVAKEMIGEILAATQTQKYYDENVGTITPPEPTTCTYDVGGKCINIPQFTPYGTYEFGLGTPTPDLNTLNVQKWGKVTGDKPIPLYSTYGEGSQQVGYIYPEKKWPIYSDVSGQPTIDGELEGHYYATILDCVFEEIDLNSDLTQTKGHKHDWHHEADTHAHCWSEDGSLLAKLNPNPGHGIFNAEVWKENDQLIKAKLNMLWIKAKDGIELENEK